MSSKKPSTKELIGQFTEIINCLGVERIRVSGFRLMFKGYPELQAMLNEVQMAQNEMKHYKAYFGPVMQNDPVEDHFGR